MRICCLCGHRSSAFLCVRDGTPTSVIAQDTDFPGRLLPGDRLLGRFVVEELVGVGGMGAVYRGLQLGTRKAVAIKVLWRDLASDPIEVKRFGREARAAGMLVHPNIVRVVDFGADTPSNALFIVMEFLAGRKLGDLMAEAMPLPPLRTVHIIAQTCKALAETHRKGVVHRDIKPDNIFLQDMGGKRDFVKLLDFGLSVFANPTPNEKPLTKPGFVVGSPEYIAPEQAAGDPVGPAADLYSLGVVLYECLGGRLPFYGTSNQDLLRKHIMSEPPLLVAPPGAAPIPAALVRVVMRCLDKDPTLRPASADALENELQRACDPSVPRITGPITGPLAVLAPGSVEAASQEGPVTHDTAKTFAGPTEPGLGGTPTQVSPHSQAALVYPPLAAMDATGKLPSATMPAAPPASVSAPHEPRAELELDPHQPPASPRRAKLAWVVWPALAAVALAALWWLVRQI